MNRLVKVIANVFSADFAPRYPACPSSAGGVKGPGSQVEAFERRLLVREVPARTHGPAVTDVDRHRSRWWCRSPGGSRASYSRNGTILRPRGAPELDKRRITLASFGRNLLEPVLRCLLGRGCIDRLERLHNHVTVLPTGATESIAEAGRSMHYIARPPAPRRC